jgi:hypothetical protein
VSFVELFARERASRQQTEHIVIHGRSSGLHQVERERVACVVVGVNDSHPRIEADSSQSQPRFGFEDCVAVVADGVDRVDRHARIPSQEGGALAEGGSMDRYR